MRKSIIGTNPDGSPHYHYQAEKDELVVWTGPIAAALTMSDGTVYDVTDPFVAVTAEHHDELLDAIGGHYEQHGHPHHKAGYPFKYAPKKG